MTNHTLQKKIIQAGAIFAALSVALGALGAHQLKDLISESSLNAFETGVRYLFYHSLALILLGSMMRKLNEKTLTRVIYLFLLGMALFSGSLFLLSTYPLFLSNPNYILWIAGLTPIGGVCFIAGWLLLAYNGYQISTGTSSGNNHRRRSSSEEK